MIAWPEDYEAYRFKYDTGSEVLCRDVYRRVHLDGPPVILIHEAPGLDGSTVAIANRLFEHGFTVVMPSLLLPPTTKHGPVQMVRGLTRICVAREFGALTRGQTSPVSEWLRALARKESQDRKDAKVGVIGMCFSGGFALATALDPSVGAAVLSQPSLPFIYVTDIGLSPADLQGLRARVGTGDCLRALRYTADVKSPQARMDRLACLFPAMERVDVETTDWRKHSVIKDGIADGAEANVKDAWRETLAFLRSQLMGEPRT